MASTADFKNGLCIEYNHDLYMITEFQHVKPGKGPAFVRTKLKNIRTGKVLDNTFSAGHKVVTARVEKRAHQFLFKDDMGYQVGNSSKMSFRPTFHADEDHIDHQVASYGIDILKQQHAKPFFLAIGIVKPHLPFDAPVRFFDALPENELDPFTAQPVRLGAANIKPFPLPPNTF